MEAVEDLLYLIERKQEMNEFLLQCYMKLRLPERFMITVLTNMYFICKR